LSSEEMDHLKQSAEGVRKTNELLSV
jgi:hypothetical protein